MKNNKIFILFLAIIFLLTGCSEKIESGTEVTSKTDTKNSTGSLICTRKATATNAEINLDYEVDYKSGYITKLHSTEKIISSDSTILDTYEKAYKDIFIPYKKLKYYDNEVTRTDDYVLSDTIIQYDKVDMDQLKAIENTDQSVIKNGKVLLKDWLEFAENFGTECVEK